MSKDDELGEKLGIEQYHETAVTEPNAVQPPESNTWSSGEVLPVAAM